MPELIIVGISAFQHDSAAAIVIDGKVCAFAEEERFTRQKHTGEFPVLALKWCLHQAGITIHDVNIVAFYMHGPTVLKRFILEAARTLARGGLSALFQRTLWTAAFFHQINSIRHRFPMGKPIVQVPHHLCHAAYTYFLSGLESATIVTIDSIGEYDTATIFVGAGPRIVKVDAVSGFDSIGYAYGAVTEHLGYKRGDGEGTVMAMAAFSPPDHDAACDLIRILPNGRFELNRSYFSRRFTGRNHERLSPIFTERFGPRRSWNMPVTSTHETLASTLQLATERAVVCFVERAIKLTGISDICLSGGVGLNSVVNQKIAALQSINSLFIAPAANDAGAALGAALYTYASETGQRPTTMNAIFSGPRYDDSAVLEAIRTAGVAYNHIIDPPNSAAEDIAKGKIVAWFQGAMESGPRALGCRSILADPRRADTKEILNDRIKFREAFRPFAPAALIERAHEWFEMEEGEDLPYMLRVVSIRKDKIAQIPAVAHIDGSARLQTVSRQVNPRFYSLIKCFNDLTGVPLVVNTSFNVKGEPIVATPNDALKCFFSTGIDVMYIENFSITKKS